MKQEEKAVSLGQKNQQSWRYSLHPSREAWWSLHYNSVSSMGGNGWHRNTQVRIWLESLCFSSTMSCPLYRCKFWYTTILYCMRLHTSSLPYGTPLVTGLSTSRSIHTSRSEISQRHVQTFLNVMPKKISQCHVESKEQNVHVCVHLTACMSSKWQSLVA